MFRRHQFNGREAAFRCLNGTPRLERSRVSGAQPPNDSTQFVSITNFRLLD